MRAYSFLVSLCMAAGLATAFTPIDLSELPTCSLGCLAGTLSRTPCNLTDFSCICQDASFVASDVTPCVLASCTMEDSLKLLKIQAKMCDKPNESRQELIYLTTKIGLAIQLAFFSLRIFTRVMIQKKLAIDDWFLIVGMGITILGAVVVLKTVDRGFGLHLWQIDAQDVPNILTGFLIAEATYPVILCLVRMSLMVFYLRIFPGLLFRRMVQCIMISGAIQTVLFFFLIIFQCTPVQFAWDKATPTPGKCLDMNALAYAGAIVALLYDLVNLVLPVNELRKLQISTPKKVGIMVMFALGSCGCIASLIRMKSIAGFSGDVNNDPDPTWSNVDILFWTEVEIAAAMAFTCSPSFKALVFYIIPSNFREEFRQNNKPPRVPVSDIMAHSSSRYTRRCSRAPSGAESVLLPDRLALSDDKLQLSPRPFYGDLEANSCSAKIAVPKPAAKR
ncbi:hypothetical protein GQ53DRAFT_471213 [Thozetella sp. PMI_491]|nr:hypothetical protein GQ53DRAFT_471213 [Thozetella sp. PMI_491]